MNLIFKIKDKFGKEVHLSKERWSHIRKKHPEVEEVEHIEETIRKPDTIKNSLIDSNVKFYYKYFKHRKSSEKYLLVLVKYLNGSGYVTTAYYEDKIK